MLQELHVKDMLQSFLVFGSMKIWCAVQERALRITLADPTTDDTTSTTAAAALLHADSKMSTATLLEFAQRFCERGQHAAAAHAYIGASRPLEALELVELHDIPLDEELANKIAPAERAADNEAGDHLLYH